MGVIDKDTVTVPAVLGEVEGVVLEAQERQVLADPEFS